MQRPRGMRVHVVFFVRLEGERDIEQMRKNQALFLGQGVFFL